MLNDPIAISGVKNSGKTEASYMLQYLLNAPKPFRRYFWYKIGLKFPKRWKIISFANLIKILLSPNIFSTVLIECSPITVCVFIISYSLGVRVAGFKSIESGMPTFPISCNVLVFDMNAAVASEVIHKNKV